MARQDKRIQEEAARLATNTSLSQAERQGLLVDKYSIVFRRLLHVLDRVGPKATGALGARDWARETAGMATK